MSAEPLLAIENLSLAFGAARVLDAVSLSLAPGETLGLVGESGSGKTVAALAVMGLNDPAASVERGCIWFEGEDLAKAGERRLRELRGRRLAYIFQHPRRALHPMRTVGRQILDVLGAHTALSRTQRKSRAMELLRRVGALDQSVQFDAYSFELSGGLCQRATIALALAASPSLLIADEPTAGLDVSAQAVVLDLMASLASVEGMALLLITHDLALASERCRRIAVMHAGQIVESGPAAELVASPRHPYTRALVGATPRPGLTIADLVPAPGTTPDVAQSGLPACRYAPRCAQAHARCASERPRLSDVGAGHEVACWAIAP